MDNKKIEQYITLKTQLKQIESMLKLLEGEIKDEIKGKVEMGGYVLSKKSRTTYVMKPGVDMQAIKTRYPGICTTTYGIDPTKLDIEIVKQEYPEAYYENISVVAKDLYKVAENPKELVEEKISEYLEVKEAKQEEVKDIDF